MKILLVDDDPVTLRLLGRALERAGYQIVAAESGADALRRVPAEQPDVIVLDVMMPGIDGLETTRQLRANPLTANVPIILLTSAGQADRKLAGFESGADDYMVKPVMIAELIARIKALLRRSQMTAEAALPHGRLIGFLGVKGGVGTTTLLVNVAVALSDGSRDVVVLDAHPQASAVSLLLGLSPSIDRALAQTVPSQLSRRMLEGCLQRHASEIRVLALPRSEGLHDAQSALERTAVVLAHLETMGDVVLVDMGNGLASAALEMAKRCDRTVLVLEADDLSMSLARVMIETLEGLGVAGGRLKLVMVNRSGASSVYRRTDAEKQLGRELVGMIAPAAEVQLRAIKTGTPVMVDKPDTVVATQMKEIAKRI